MNKNSVPGDTKPMVPGGIRVGTPALTTRGLIEKDFEKVAEFMDRGIKIAIKLNAEGENSKALKNFKSAIEKPTTEMSSLKKEVVDFASKFYMP